MDLYELAENVSDEKTFIVFVEALYKDREDFIRNESKIPPISHSQDTRVWTNNTIEGYLEASTAWVKSTNFGRKMDSSEYELKDISPWRRFAAFLLAGTVYE